MRPCGWNKWPQAILIAAKRNDARMGQHRILCHREKVALLCDVRRWDGGLVYFLRGRRVGEFDGRRLQFDAELPRNLFDLAWREPSLEELHEFILSGLPKHHSVEGERGPQRHELVGISTQWKSRYMTLDHRSVWRRKHPERLELIGRVRVLMDCGLEYRIPAIAEWRTITIAVGRRDILADSVPLVPVDAAFSLFKINWVRRQIPMHDRVAVVMEVEPLLPHGRAGQDERPEGRVECRPYMTCAVSIFRVISLLLTEPGGEASPHASFRRADGLCLGIDPDVVDTDGCSAKADGLGHLVGNGFGGLLSWHSPHTETVLEDVGVLVKHGLKATIHGVLDHSHPVRFRPIQASYKRVHFGEVVKIAEPPRNPTRREPNMDIARGGATQHASERAQCENRRIPQACFGYRIDKVLGWLPERTVVRTAGIIE